MSKSAVNIRKGAMHNIGGTFYYCCEDGRDYKAKDAGSFRRHKATIHDMDETYYLYGGDRCDYKAKSADIVNAFH